MTLLGHIQNGVVVFDQPISLPNGTPVQVEVAQTNATARPTGHSAETLAERLAGVIGAIDDLPSDASINVDHYLYGLPKRE